MPRIVFENRSEVIAEYNFGRKSVITVGNGKGNDIVIDDKNISEQHCIITRKDGKYELKDNNTLTGTRIDGKPVTVKELAFGNVIGIGVYSLIFRPDSRQRVKSSRRSAEAGQEEEESPQASKALYLLGVYGKFRGKKYELKTDETYIGREKSSPKGVANDIVLAGDMTVSKGHARINCRGDKCIITDIGSTGGIAVNGEKVGQLNDMALSPGDEVAIGRTIFRLVEEDNDDYSAPRKYGIFLLKIRRPLSILINLIVFAVAVFAVYKGVQGYRIVNATTSRYDIDINRYWSPSQNVVRTSQPEYDISSSPAIADLNGDGVNDIAYLNSSGLLYAWDGKKGSQLWKPVEVYNSGKTSPAVADMNNDKVPDIVTVSDTSMLYIVDGQTGGIIRRETLGGAIADLSPAVADLDGNGQQDVVVCSEDGMVHFIYSPGYDLEMRKYTEFIASSHIYASPVVIKTDKISPLVVVCSDDSKVSVFDGKTRSKKTIDLIEKTGKAHLIASAPAVGDITGDGIPEVVVQSNVPQYVSAIDITKFSVNWTYFVEPIPPAGLKHISSPIITDINHDGENDVVVFSANGYAYGLKGKTGYPTGEMIWKAELQDSGRTIASPALYDIDKDGALDIVIGSEGGIIYAVRSSSSRKDMEVIARVRASNVPITSSVAIADINNDGLAEVIYSNVTNVVQMLNTNIKTFRNRVIWPEYLGNPLRSGMTTGAETDRPYLMLIGAGFGLLVLYVVLKLFITRKILKQRPRVVYL